MQSTNHLRSVFASFSFFPSSFSSILGLFRSIIIILWQLQWLLENPEKSVIRNLILSHTHYNPNNYVHVIMQAINLHRSCLFRLGFVRSSSGHSVRESLRDKHGRSHNYLRISLTERCNLRCE